MSHRSLGMQPKPQQELRHQRSDAHFMTYDNDATFDQGSDKSVDQIEQYSGVVMLMTRRNTQVLYLFVNIQQIKIQIQIS